MKEVIRQRMLETKRNIILEEISHIFESEGYSRIKMQEIARRLQISVGALYKLFDSKESLYYAYLEYQIRRFYERLLHACDAEGSPEGCLHRYIRMKFEVFAAKRRALEDPVIGDPLFFLKMNTRQSEPARPIYEFLATLFEQIDRSRPLKERDFLKTAYLFNAFTTGYVEYWLQHGGSFDDSEEEVLEHFLKGIVQ